MGRDARSKIGQLLSHGQYGRYLLGNFASSIGVWIQRVAIAWIVWEESKSLAWLGLIAFAETGPTLLLGPMAGVLLDRMDQLKALRLSQLAIVLYSSILAVLVLAGGVSLPVLVAMVLFRGAVFAANRPARQTVVYGIVGRAHLSRALPLNAMVLNTSKFIGPAVAGLALVTVGPGWTLALAAGLQVAFSIVLATLSVDPLPRKNLVPGSVLAEVIDGLRYIISHTGVRFQFIILIAAALLAKPAADFLPALATDVFARGADGLAILFVMHGIGATLGGVCLSVIGSLKWLVWVSLMGLMSLSAALICLSATNLFGLACLLLLIIGLSTVVLDISSQTLIQSAIRSRYRGRTMSTYGMVAQGGPAIGAIAMGVAAERIGLQSAFFAGALVCLLVSVWALFNRHAMRTFLDGIE